MTKQNAIHLFGTAAELARALGYTRSAITQWPQQLDHGRKCLVVGAAFLSGRVRSRTQLDTILRAHKSS